MGRDRTGRDETRRDGTGRDGTGRDGTGQLPAGKSQNFLRPTQRLPACRNRSRGRGLSGAQGRADRPPVEALEERQCQSQRQRAGRSLPIDAAALVVSLRSPPARATFQPPGRESGDFLFGGREDNAESITSRSEHSQHRAPQHGECLAVADLPNVPTGSRFLLMKFPRDKNYSFITA